MDLHKLTQGFGPQWFAPVMGIGALAIALSLSYEYLGLMILETSAKLVTGLTASLILLFLLPTTARVLKYPDSIRSDFDHPIRSQFFPTLPISLLVLAIALIHAFSAPWVRSAVLGLYALGAGGIFLMGLILSLKLFTDRNIETHHGVFAWYIPPVSHILIPVVGFMVLAEGWVTGMLSSLVLISSLTGLGVGGLMFLFLAPIIFYRYAYEDLPDSKLAPTFMIGIAPTSILVVDFLRLEPVMASMAASSQFVQTLDPAFTGLATVLWGFSAWWMALTVGVLLHYASRDEHPFSFTWWAYTFPLGAFTIATFAAGRKLGVQALQSIGIGLTGLLVFVILVVGYLTSKQVRTGEVFEH